VSRCHAAKHTLLTPECSAAPRRAQSLTLTHACTRRHRDGGFYPPVASAVSMMVQQLPTSIVAEGLIVTTTMYFLSNRSSDPVTYALSVVLNAMFGIMASQVVRTVASWVNSAALGQVLCGIFMVSTVVFSGFIITFDNLPIYWQWLYWGLPFSWYMRAMAIGEFSSSDYDARMPDGQRRGDLFLQMFSFKTQRYWIWYGMLLLAGWTALWFIVQTAVLTYKRRPAFFTTRKDTAEASDAAASSTTVAVAMASSVTDHKDLQSAPVVLSFTDVHYYVADPAHPKSGRELHLLDAVFGVFRPKTMTALMGSSGAGKTTLMDVLASRKTTGRVAGCVLVNGQPKEERSFARMIGCVIAGADHSKYDLSGTHTYCISYVCLGCCSCGGRERIVEVAHDNRRAVTAREEAGLVVKEHPQFTAVGCVTTELACSEFGATSGNAYMNGLRRVLSELGTNCDGEVGSGALTGRTRRAQICGADGYSQCAGDSARGGGVQRSAAQRGGGGRDVPGALHARPAGADGPHIPGGAGRGAHHSRATQAHHHGRRDGC
jgi:hypothetical protein